MVDFETILEAYLDCRKRKRSTVGATEFELDYVHNLVELMNEVNSRQYKIGKSICFVVRYPRYREVFAGEFRDRIIHHYIAFRLEPLFEKIFCDRTYNCRKGKGQLAGVTQLAEDIREESEDYTKDAYVMKVDLKGFFMSIPKPLLAKMVDDFIVENYYGDDKEDLRWICGLVIMHRPELNCEPKYSDLDKKVAVMEALTPYKEKLMMAYVNEKTCNCLRGQLVLPSTPVISGYGSYCCNSTAPSTPTTGA